MYETIEYAVKGQVAWLALNRPEKLNAFTETMNGEIVEALKAAARDDNVRCLVITGKGRAFCAGEDLAGVDGDTDHGEVLRRRYNPMIRQLKELEKPVVAAVNGVAAGAGMSLALACDFRLAHEQASFVEAFIHVGLIPDSGSLYFLPRLVGHAKALELAVLGERLSAEEARRLGLVTQVLPAEEWEDGVARFAERLAGLPTKAIGLIKRYLHRSWHADLQEMLELEAYGQRIAGQTNDHREGLRAFFGKRKANFHGH